MQSFESKFLPNMNEKHEEILRNKFIWFMRLARIIHMIEALKVNLNDFMPGHLGWCNFMYHLEFSWECVNFVLKVQKSSNIVA